MLVLSPIVASNASRSPSGDHEPTPTVAVSKCVTACGDDPSRLATQTWKLPLRLDTKATRVPSGENRPAISARVESQNGESVAGDPGELGGARSTRRSPNLGCPMAAATR